MVAPYAASVAGQACLSRRDTATTAAYTTGSIATFVTSPRTREGIRSPRSELLGDYSNEPDWISIMCSTGYVLIFPRDP